MPLLNASSIDALLSGRQRGLSSALTRSALGAAEPLYAAVVATRNRLYDTGLLKTHRLATPVVSVGNITAGGTGKTPVVQWLAASLRGRGMRPAVLMRGYGKGAISDEQDLLAESLADDESPVPVHANPDRIVGAHAVLEAHPHVNLFILDDGFQHRRLGRNFDLVLIDATNPFGYGRVHPRGLLREPMAGLARADAFILTRSDLVAIDVRRSIERTLRANNRVAPIYRARHAITGLRSAGQSAADPPDTPMESLASRKLFAFAGIANPLGLDAQLRQFPGEYVGGQWFADHHNYTAADLAAMHQRARAAGADTMLVTEKDWRKLRRLEGPEAQNPPLLRLALEIEFIAPAGEGLLDLIQAQIGCP